MRRQIFEIYKYLPFGIKQLKFPRLLNYKIIYSYNKQAETYTNSGEQPFYQKEKDEELSDLSKIKNKAQNNEQTYIELYQSGYKNEALTYLNKSLDSNPNLYKTLYNKGVILYSLGKQEEALKCYSESIDLNPYYFGSHFNKGLIHYELGQINEALEHLNKSIELNPLYTEAYRMKGEIYIKEGKLSEASSCFEKAADFNPKEYYYFYQQSKIQSKIAETNMSLSFLGNLVLAEQLLDQAIKLNPLKFELYQNKAVLLNILDKKNDVLVSIDTAIQLNPYDYYSYFIKGFILESEGQFEEALYCYKKVVELNPNYEQGYGKKAKMLAFFGFVEEAIDSYNYSIQMNPKNYYSYTGKGIQLANKGLFNEAIKSIDKSIELNPKFAEAYFYKAVYLARQPQNHEEMIPCLNQSFQLKSKLRDQIKNFGLFFEKNIQEHKEILRFQEEFGIILKAVLQMIELGYNEGALKLLNSLHENLQNSDIIQIIKGLVFMKMSKNEEAQVCFSQASKLNNHKNQKEFKLLQSGQIDKGLSYIKRLINLEPQYDRDFEIVEINIEKPYQQNQLSVNLEIKEQLLLNIYLQLEQGQYLELLNNVIQLLEIYPSQDKLYILKGISLQELGHIEEAKQCYLTALKLDFNSFTPSYNLGEIFTNEKQFNLALEYFTNAFKINPNSFETALKLGDTLQSLEKNQEALEYYSKALDLNPDSIEVIEKKIILLLELGKNFDAILCLEKKIQS